MMRAHYDFEAVPDASGGQQGVAVSYQGEANITTSFQCETKR
jgi:hypothetical protein